MQLHLVHQQKRLEQVQQPLVGFHKQMVIMQQPGDMALKPLALMQQHLVIILKQEVMEQLHGVHIHQLLHNIQQLGVLHHKQMVIMQQHLVIQPLPLAIKQLLLVSKLQHQVMEPLQWGVMQQQQV